MDYPAVSCGVSEHRDENFTRASPRTFLSWFDFAHHDPEQAVEGSGVQFRSCLDSRFSLGLIPASQLAGWRPKPCGGYAGMTDSEQKFAANCGKLDPQN